MSLPRRDPPAVTDDTPIRRMELALRLGENAIDAYLASQPAGVTREQARSILQRNKNRGRRPSAAADSLR